MKIGDQVRFQRPGSQLSQTSWQGEIVEIDGDNLHIREDKTGKIKVISKTNPWLKPMAPAVTESFDEFGLPLEEGLITVKALSEQREDFQTTNVPLSFADQLIPLVAKLIKHPNRDEIEIESDSVSLMWSAEIDISHAGISLTPEVPLQDIEIQVAISTDEGLIRMDVMIPLNDMDYTFSRKRNDSVPTLIPIEIEIDRNGYAQVVFSV